MKPVPVSFHVGPLLLHTYGLGLAAALWFGYRYLDRRVLARGYTHQPQTIPFLIVAFVALVGARAMHVIANFTYYAGHPGDIVLIWNGGLSSYGGLILGVPAGMFFARRAVPELGVIALADIVAPVLMVSWGIGRLLGPQLMSAGGGAPTTAWYGMYYAAEVGRRVPVPVFQAIDSFVIFGLLILIERKVRRLPNGFVISAAMALWGLSRFLEQHFWLGARAQVGATVSESKIGPLLVQAAGLALFVAGVGLMAFLWWKRRPDEAADHASRGSVSDGVVDPLRSNPLLS